MASTITTMDTATDFTEDITEYLPIEVMDVSGASIAENSAAELLLPEAEILSLLPAWAEITLPQEIINLNHRQAG